MDDLTIARGFPLEHRQYNATNFLTLWDFEGVFKHSPLFYGWYSNNSSHARSYSLPIAYFVTSLIMYAYSFFAILKKMAENSRMSKLSEKDDECIFSWKLFTAWDYMIGNTETALNRSASIVMGFKEALLEEEERKKSSRKWKIICFRALVNSLVLGLLSFSAFAVVKVVGRSQTEVKSTVWRKNELTIVMSLITLCFPMVFEVLGLLEQYHPRKQLRLQLARIMVLNLLNLYSLIFALFHNINPMTSEALKNITCIESSLSLDKSIYSTFISSNNLSYFTTDVMQMAPLISENRVWDLAYNISSTSYPIMKQVLEEFSNQGLTELYSSNDTSPDYDYQDSGEKSIIYTRNSKNETIPSISLLNQTIGNYTKLNFTDFEETLANYVSYILYYTFNNITHIGGNLSSERVYNYTNNNLAAITNNTFKIVKSTVISVLNNSTNMNHNDSIDQKLSTIYNEISASLSSLFQNITSSYIITSKTTKLLDNFVNKTEILPKVLPPVKSNYSLSTCWETVFGQELIKLTVMDLIMTILSSLAIDFFRGVFVRIMNRCWCWDLERSFPRYGDFKVAENILHLVNNQGMVWMGMFFSPGLVALNVMKLYIMMYFRAWTVLTCNIPHAVIFRASRSNNFYYALLLMMLFLCVLPVGYAIVWIRPSLYCGPFSRYQNFFYIFTETIENSVPRPVQMALQYIASPGIVIPLIVLLVLIIYYLTSLTGALREANNDLKIQLQRERMEEKRKMVQIAGNRGQGGLEECSELSNTNIITKWKKLTESSRTTCFDGLSKQKPRVFFQPTEEKNFGIKNDDIFTIFIKTALDKASEPDEQQNSTDRTHTGEQDALPNNFKKSKERLYSLVKSFCWNISDLPISINKKDLKKYPLKVDRLISENINSANMRYAEIQETFLRYSTLDRFNIDFQDKENIRTESAIPSTSECIRQCCGSSAWSDIVPIITISKHESEENMLHQIDVKNNISISKSSDELKDPERIQFKSKIKCLKSLVEDNLEANKILIAYQIDKFEN